MCQFNLYFNSFTKVLKNNGSSLFQASFDVFCTYNEAYLVDTEMRIL